MSETLRVVIKAGIAFRKAVHLHNGSEAGTYIDYVEITEAAEAWDKLMKKLRTDHDVWSISNELLADWLEFIDECENDKPKCVKDAALEPLEKN